MRQLNILENELQFIDIDGKETLIAKGEVYAVFNADTVSFILTRYYPKRRLVIMTSKASDLQVNGTTYTITQLKDGDVLEDMFPANGIKFEVVDELPDIDDAKDSVVYLVYDEEDENYIEYIRVYDEENEEYKWEELGHTTDIDLSGYYTSAEVDTLLANYATVTALNTLAAEVEENGLVTASALIDLDTNKQDVIDDLNTIRSGAALGATALQSYTETDPVFSASAAAGITSSDISGWNGLATTIRDDEEVIAAAFNQLNASSYQIPSGGIPLSDLASGVQTSLGKADTAVQPNDLSSYATKTTLESSVQTLITALQSDELAIAAAINDLNNRITALENSGLSYGVDLIDVNDPSIYYTLDEDIVTENIPQGTTFVIVAYVVGADDFECGDFTISLESNGSPVTVTDCEFTTANVDEQAYTLTIEVNDETLVYDFTLSSNR